MPRSTNPVCGQMPIWSHYQAVSEPVVNERGGGYLGTSTQKTVGL